MKSLTKLSLLMGIDNQIDSTIEQILKSNSIPEQLILLGNICKVTVWFNRPIRITTRRPYKTCTEYTFSGFFKYYNSLCYRTRSGARTGSIIDLEAIDHYEPVPESIDRFKTYESFQKRFDPIFITKTEIKKLWNSKSSQTGNHYRPSDFKNLGYQGRKLMKEFLKHFKGINTAPNEYPYRESVLDNGPSKYKIYTAHHKSYGSGSAGRDLSISHQTNLPWIHYASEFPDCGNGTYGLIANKSQYLHLEND